MAGTCWKYLEISGTTSCQFQLFHTACQCAPAGKRPRSAFISSELQGSCQNSLKMLFHVVSTYLSISQPNPSTTLLYCTSMKSSGANDGKCAGGLLPVCNPNCVPLPHPTVHLLHQPMNFLEEGPVRPAVRRVWKGHRR